MARAAIRHKVLALDLARKTGWAIGAPGGRPRSGVVRFASDGASHEAVFAAAYDWVRAMIEDEHPRTVVWEAPLPSSFMRGKTNAATTALLFGLPAVVGLACWSRDVLDLRQATPAEVRAHFIGRNMKSKDAEIATKAQCRRLGWSYQDDNECDALALWDYVAALVAPELAIIAPTMPGLVRHG